MMEENPPFWVALQTVCLIIHFLMKGEMGRVTDLYPIRGQCEGVGQLVRKLEKKKIEN